MEKLIDFVLNGLDWVFLCNFGLESIEVVIKLVCKMIG